MGSRIARQYIVQSCSRGEAFVYRAPSSLPSSSDAFSWSAILRWHCTRVPAATTVTDTLLFCLQPARPSYRTYRRRIHASTSANQQMSTVSIRSQGAQAPPHHQHFLSAYMSYPNEATNLDPAGKKGSVRLHGTFSSMQSATAVPVLYSNEVCWLVGSYLFLWANYRILLQLSADMIRNRFLYMDFLHRAIRSARPPSTTISPWLSTARWGVMTMAAQV